MNEFFDQVERFNNWITASSNWEGSDGIPARFAEHLWYCGLTLFIASLIAIPLGILIGHTGRGGFFAVSLANVARAIPTLGLLLIVVMFTSVGTTPVIVSLVALAVPPILVNTFEGVRGVEGQIKDAAKGMGMTGWGVAFKAEVPIALPLILLGLRTSAIQVVATATVAAYASLGGLGRFVIDGFNRKDYSQVVGGSVLVVLLAIAVQLLFVLVRRIVLSPGLREARTS